MKRKFKKKSIYIFITLLIVIIGIIVSLIFFSKNKTGVETIIKYEKDYSINITYPIIGNKIDENISKMIKEKEKDFLKVVKENKSKYPYELIINYNSNTFKDVNFLHFTVYQYTGGAHHLREDISYYYTNSFINISNLFSNNYLEKLSKLSYYHVMKYGENKNLNFDETWVKKGTEKNKDNFKHIKLTDQGLTILFPPYQISSWADGEIEITIPFNELKGIINEKYYIEPVKEQIKEPLKKEIRDLEKYKNKKLIALTFDDGPGYQTTEHLLEELNKRDALATFFMLGSRVEQFPDIVKKIYQTGHLVASHTYNHKNLFNLNDYEIIKEIENTNNLIYNIIGVKPIYIRPPYGNTNDNIKKIGNMHTILWNIDTLDWKLKNRNKISENIIKNASDGSIILMHDLYKESVEGAIIAVDELKKQGYEFVTIEEMIKLKGITLDKQQSYRKF